MSEAEVRGLTEWTDEESKALGGDMLTVPEDARAIKRTLAKNTPAEREVTVHQWKERARITFIGGPEPIDDDFAAVGHEAMRIGLQATKDYPSPNAGRLLPTDYIHVYSALRTKDPATLKDLANNGNGIEAKYYGRFWMMKRNVQRMADFLKALGYHNKLSGRRYFQGFASILDVVPEFKGQELMVTLEQGEGFDGEVRDTVVAYSAIHDD